MDYKGLLDDLRLISMRCGIECLNAALAGDNKVVQCFHDFDVEVHVFIKEIMAQE